MSDERTLPDGRWQLLTTLGHYEISTCPLPGELQDLDTLLHFAGVRREGWSPFETMVFDVRNPKRIDLDSMGWSTEAEARRGHEAFVAKWGGRRSA